MNQAETWQRSARQRTAQSIEKLNRHLETLRRNHIEEASQSGEAMAKALLPVARSLHKLTEETRNTIHHQAEEASQATENAQTAVRELQTTSTEARDVLANLKRLKRGFTWRMMGWAVAACLVTNLPLIGWCGWLAWTNHKQAVKWKNIAADLNGYILEIHPHMKPSRQQQIDAIYQARGLHSPSQTLSRTPKVPPNGTKNPPNENGDTKSPTEPGKRSNDN